MVLLNYKYSVNITSNYSTSIWIQNVSPPGWKKKTIFLLWWVYFFDTFSLTCVWCRFFTTIWILSISFHEIWYFSSINLLDETQNRGARFPQVSTFGSKVPCLRKRYFQDWGKAAACPCLTPTFGVHLWSNPQKHEDASRPREIFDMPFLLFYLNQFKNQ